MSITYGFPCSISVSLACSHALCVFPLLVWAKCFHLRQRGLLHTFEGGWSSRRWARCWVEACLVICFSLFPLPVLLRDNLLGCIFYIFSSLPFQYLLCILPAWIHIFDDWNFKHPECWEVTFFSFFSPSLLFPQSSSGSRYPDGLKCQKQTKLRKSNGK